MKLTAEGRVASPLWTPDGKSLVYESGNATSLRIIAAAAGATPQPASPDGHYHPHGWSPDGRDLIVAQFTGGETGWDIVRFAPDVKSQPQFVVKTPASEGSRRHGAVAGRSVARVRLRYDGTIRTVGAGVPGAREPGSRLIARRR